MTLVCCRASLHRRGYPRLSTTARLHACLLMQGSIAACGVQAGWILARVAQLDSPARLATRRVSMPCYTRAHPRTGGLLLLAGTRNPKPSPPCTRASSVPVDSSHIDAGRRGDRERSDRWHCHSGGEASGDHQRGGRGHDRGATHANADTDRDAHPNADPRTHADAYTDTNADAKPNGNRYAETNADPSAPADRHADAPAPANCYVDASDSSK